MYRSVIAAAALTLPGAATAASPALDAIEIEFIRLLNDYRAANDLPCVSVSPTMNAAADYMSREMGVVPFFDHNEPPCNGESCSGRNPFDRILDFGHVGWTTAGENIAAGSMTAAEVFQGWRSSPGHNANMLGDGFTAIGIARVEVPASPYRVYWTNNFSNHIDGPHRCEDGLPAIGSGAPDGGSGGSGGGGSGTGGAGGGIDPACVAEGGGGSDDGWGIGPPRATLPDHCDDARRKGGGGCSTAGGLSLLGLLAVALRLRRR